MPRKQELQVQFSKKKRKRNPPRTAFKKGEEHDNGHRFQKGVSGNPGGKPQTDRLIRGWLRVDLADRAPDVACESVKLPPHSSWGRCIARRLMIETIRGNLDAAKLVIGCTEGLGDGALDWSTFDADAAPKLMEIVFVEGIDGRPATIDAGALPALPVPDE